MYASDGPDDVSTFGAGAEASSSSSSSSKPLFETPSLSNIHVSTSGVNCVENVIALASSVFNPRTRRSSVRPPASHEVSFPKYTTSVSGAFASNFCLDTIASGVAIFVVASQPL